MATNPIEECTELTELLDAACRDYQEAHERWIVAARVANTASVDLNALDRLKLLDASHAAWNEMVAAQMSLASTVSSFARSGGARVVVVLR